MITQSPARHTNDSHALLINEIAELRQKVADLEESFAMEVKENLSLFDLLGLQSVQDFADDTSTEAIRKRVIGIMGGRDDLRKELAAAKAEIARLEQLLSGKTEDSQ